MFFLFQSAACRVARAGVESWEAKDLEATPLP